MSEHRADIFWFRNGASFKNGKYSLKHTWRFDGENQPNRSTISEIHQESLKNCFIANSIKTNIEIL